MAEAHGFRLLRVTGAESERDLPFAGLAQLLRPLADGIDRLPEPQAQALGVALALREGRDVDRFAVSAATLTLLAAAGEDRPVGIVVDDAHLLDRPSAAALTFVARRLLADAVFLVAAIRPARSNLWPGGCPSSRSPGSTRVPRELLAADVAPARLTGDQARRIARPRGGQPAGDPGARRPARGVDDGASTLPAPLPDEAAAAAFDRLAGELTDPDLRVLQMVAVAGGDLVVVGRVCAGEGLASPAWSRRSGWGWSPVAADRVEFAHPLARSTV